MKLQKYKTMKTLAVAVFATAILSTGLNAEVTEEQYQTYVSTVKPYQKNFEKFNLRLKPKGYRLNIQYCKSNNISYNYKSNDLYKTNVKQFQFLYYHMDKYISPKKFKRIKEEIEKITKTDSNGNLQICLTKAQKKQLGE